MPVMNPATILLIAQNGRTTRNDIKRPRSSQLSELSPRLAAGKALAPTQKILALAQMSIELSVTPIPTTL
jgi:hypothetical protein